jgi:hypothetical protein
MRNLLIDTPKGNGEIDKIYISELGFLMLRVYFKNGTFTTYNLGKHDPNDNMFTNELMENQKEINL